MSVSKGPALIGMAWRAAGRSCDGPVRIFSGICRGALICCLLALLLLRPEASLADPVKSKAEVESYIEGNIRSFTTKLAQYNEKHKITRPTTYRWNISYMDWKVDLLEDDRVFVYIKYTVGPWSPAWGRVLFELQWQDEELEFIGYQTKEQLDRAKKGEESLAQNLATQTRERCTHNYFDPHPCLDTLKNWREFVQFHDFELDRESAAIYQAYREHDVGRGDRLIARARGLGDPAGKSAFGLQDHVASLNLEQYRGRMESPCGFNIYTERPCMEARRLYQDFLKKHGLDDSLESAAMFSAYAEGDFKTADTHYALAKGLPIPAYGYIPTGAAHDVARLRLPPQVGDQACTYDPYAEKPCLESDRLWQEFAARYQLEDTQENASIFANYARGEYKAADQLLAQAKGVTHEQLLEAAGVPSGDLIIEVYPGNRIAAQ